MSEEQRKYTGTSKAEEATRLEAQAKAIEKIIEKEIEILGLKTNMKVLDAGCGTGAVTRKIASKVFPAETFGIDIDPLFIDKAKKKAYDEGVKNIRFKLGNVDSLKYDDGFFDLAFCHLVLEHVQNPVKTVAELKRVTRKGGIVAAFDIDDSPTIKYLPRAKCFDLKPKFSFQTKTTAMGRLIGRNLYSIFIEAGLHSVKIHSLPIVLAQQKTEALGGVAGQYVKLLEQSRDVMIREGVTFEKDFDQTMKEVRHFLNRLSSPFIASGFLAVGKH